jgi:hypothetical protein
MNTGVMLMQHRGHIDCDFLISELGAHIPENSSPGQDDINPTNNRPEHQSRIFYFDAKTSK